MCKGKEREGGVLECRGVCVCVFDWVLRDRGLRFAVQWYE